MEITIPPFWDFRSSTPHCHRTSPKLLLQLLLLINATQVSLEQLMQCKQLTKQTNKCNNETNNAVEVDRKCDNVYGQKHSEHTQSTCRERSESTHNALRAHSDSIETTQRAPIEDSQKDQRALTSFVGITFVCRMPYFYIFLLLHWTLQWSLTRVTLDRFYIIDTTEGN